MDSSRRALVSLLPALALAQQQERLPSQAFPLEKLTMRQSGPIQLFQILTGDTHSGFRLDLHESILPPGAVPHEPHRHAHEELLFVWQGELEVTVNGAATKVGPGGCAYLASNDLHGYRNSGTAPARYFVLALGTD